MEHNLRHLRVFVAAAALASVTRAAEACHLSQPAVTQALGKLEGRVGADLFKRTPQGLFATDLGRLFARRVSRALSHLDAVSAAIAPRLRLTATVSQLRALVALREAENYTLAARRLGVAQPTAHKAVGQLEREATRPLFERTASGIRATRAGEALADAACLAFAELAQADMEVADALGREVGRIVVGAMPLSRSHVLPRAIVRFRARYPRLPIRVIDGPYAELLGGLRRGAIDFLIGALRDPAPIGDVEQTRLFDDSLVLVARPGHPLAGGSAVPTASLAALPCVVSPPGTPARAHFDALIGPDGVASLVETSSLVLMRGLLLASDHVGCISRLQVEADVAGGHLAALPIDLPGTSRPIGITTRRGWEPTPAQAELMAAIRTVGGSSQPDPFQ